MLYYGFGEQARHEHMSDEYKDRYQVYYYNIAEDPSLVLQTMYENTLSPNTELNKRGGSSSDIIKDLPNT